MHLPAKSPPHPVQMLVLCLLLAASVLPAGCGGSVDGYSQQPDASDLVGADADDLGDDARLDGTYASDAGEVDTVAPPAPKPPWGSFGAPSESFSHGPTYQLHGQLSPSFGTPTVSGATYTLHHLGLQQR